MIELCIKNYCHKCPRFEPVVNRIYEFGDIPVQQTVTCAYKNECNVIAYYIKSELKKEEETDA